jgi:hypothetical protein
LVILKRTKDRWQALLDLKTDSQGWLEAHGAKDVALTRMTLEDLFVALAKDETEP